MNAGGMMAFLKVSILLFDAMKSIDSTIYIYVIYI